MLPASCVERIIEFNIEFERLRKQKEQESIFTQLYGKCLTATTDFLISSALNLSLAFVNCEHHNNLL